MHMARILVENDARMIVLLSLVKETVIAMRVSMVLLSLVKETVMAMRV